MRCKCDSCNRPAREDGYCLGHSPERQRAARASNKERFKGYSLQRDYGISLQDYQDLQEQQKGRCAICDVEDGSERSNNNGSKRLAVDHDHVTGEVRGLLCASCNTGIGLMMDSPELLDKAAAYLRFCRIRKEKAVQQAVDLLDELCNS